jgi:hypothetical protein
MSVITSGRQRNRSYKTSSQLGDKMVNICHARQHKNAVTSASTANPNRKIAAPTGRRTHGALGWNCVWCLRHRVRTSLFVARRCRADAWGPRWGLDCHGRCRSFRRELGLFSLLCSLAAARLDAIFPSLPRTIVISME